MKNQNKILVALLFLSVILTSVFAGKLKGKVTKSGNNGMISIGGGTNIGGTSTGVLRFDANVFLPVYSNEFMSVGFNAGGNFNSFNKVLQPLPAVYNMANQLTNKIFLVGVGDVTANDNGYTLQVGPQVNFHLGNHFIISPIIGFGLTNMYPAREYKAVQTTDMGTKSYSYDLLKVKQAAPSGLCMTPKIRLNYMISPTVGFWTEGSYLILPSVSTQISTFKPEGAINDKGFYEERQLALGTYSTQTVTQSYNAVGINAGITIVLGGGSAERKGITEGGLKKNEVKAIAETLVNISKPEGDGIENDGIAERKGITEGGLKLTDEMTERKGWDGSVKGGSIQEKGITESGIKKTEETAERKGWDGSVKGGSIQEKGITESGIKKTEETAERKGWDGTVKGGSIQEKGINQAGIKKTEEMATERKGWDGSVKGIAERKGINENGLKKTEEIAERKGWDGSVKGIAERKGINENGLKKTDETAERKGWDGSIKGIAERKGIKEGGIRKTSDGKDDDCDGLSYSPINEQQIMIQGIDVNGIPFQHIMSAKGKSPLYQASNTEHMSPLYKGNAKMANQSCGPVTQKTTYPDGKVEEFNFACPDDAAEYQQLKNSTVPKQTQGATFGEKVNAGLHQAGSQIGQGSALLGGALPGGAVISAANVKENGNSGEQPSSISNVLKTKHDTAKNSVGNIRGMTQNPNTTTTDSITARKGWDGTVKGGNIQEKGITQSGIKKTEEMAERKGWDGSVKGIAERKGINENGLKKTDETAERKGWDGSIKGGSIQEKGINQAGIKRTSDGKDDDYDGLSYSPINEQQIMIQGIDVNGNPFEHTMYAKGQSPLYQASNTEHMSPLYKGNAKMANSSCGPVTQKTSYPDGKVEELTFACPADAAQFQQLKSIEPMQTPDSTSTQPSAFRKGWDGSVKGSKRGIDKADIRKSSSTQRKGWDGSVKGSSKGINEKGLK